MTTYDSYLELKGEVREYFDAKKVLPKISGKRPGKKCGKTYIAADRKCKSHYSEGGKLTEEGKAAAQELAGKVRARKGMAVKTPKPSSGGAPQVLQLTGYGRKGIHAYLAPVKVEKGSIERGGFINGVPSEEEKQNHYKGKPANVSFDLGEMNDGWYEYKEAVGHKSSYGYIRIEKGRVAEDVADKKELIEKLSPIKPLPDLTGSDRQVAWASDIRDKAIRSGMPHEVASKYTEAKRWIDNRENLKSRWG